jgi:uncharacterized protein (DUF302 family)
MRDSQHRSLPVKQMTAGSATPQEDKMTTPASYGLRKSVALPYEEAVSRTKEALQSEGFGVLSEIDMKAKLQEKLGVDFRRYVILGACNPPLAHKALQAELEIGLLLPCNVIVYETGKDESMVAAIDPDSMVALIGDNQAVAEVAVDARQRLDRALARI